MSLKLNERYPGRFNNPSADYPQGSFKNRTTPTSKDGSYLEKDWANDKEAFFQSLLEQVGVSPNGLVDRVGASQYYDALVEIISALSALGFTPVQQGGGIGQSNNTLKIGWSSSHEVKVTVDNTDKGAIVFKSSLANSATIPASVSDTANQLVLRDGSGSINAMRHTGTGTGNDFYQGAFEACGNGQANTIFPTYGFNQPGAYAASLQLRDANTFAFVTQGNADYADVRARRFLGYSLRIESVAPQLDMYESDWGTRSLFMNGGSIGFLTSSGGWGLRTDDAGVTYSTGSVNAGGSGVLGTDGNIKGSIWGGWLNDYITNYVNAKVPLVATQALTNAGVDDATIVTPKKLRWGFSISLTTNGYVVFPTWLGGLIFQWGRSAQIPNNTTVSVPLPMAYPTACLWASAVTSNPGSAQAGADAVPNIASLSTTAISIFANDNAAGTTALPGAYHFSIGY